MSTFLRLPLTLLAVLAAVFFLPGVALGDPPPTAAQCAADPALAGCDETAPGDAVAPRTVGDQPTDTPPAGQEGTGTTTGQQQPESPVAPAAPLPGTPAGPVVGADPVTDPPPQLCDDDPVTPQQPCPTPPGGTPATPLTCDQLATLLNLPACPPDVTCDELAALVGATCPGGPPTCETLAAMFQLDGCPAPPTSCQAFADLIGVDNCSQFPCLDASRLPAQTGDGLAPLLDGLRNLGIEQCPAQPAAGDGGTGGTATTPPAQEAAAPTGVYYANCDDARAHGATNIPAGAAGYRPELDSDSDGIACEDQTPPAVAQTPPPTGTLAYTGFDLAEQLTVAWTLLMVGSALALIARRRA
jgi:hypothetical protein